jgi:hypothetical protein
MDAGNKTKVCNRKRGKKQKRYRRRQAASYAAVVNNTNNEDSDSDSDTDTDTRGEKSSPQWSPTWASSPESETDASCSPLSPRRKSAMPPPMLDLGSPATNIETDPMGSIYQIVSKQEIAAKTTSPPPLRISLETSDVSPSPPRTPCSSLTIHDGFHSPAAQSRPPARKGIAASCVVC